MVARTLPRLTVDNRFFWQSGADGKLRLLQCQDCATFIHPPYPVCHQCLSDRLEPQVMAGTGTIDTYTVNYQQWRPGLETPYVIARVAIDGTQDVILTTNIVGCPVDEVSIGDKVRVTFEHQDDVYLPLFEKVSFEKVN